MSRDTLLTHLVAEEPDKHNDEYSLYSIQDTRATNNSTNPIHVTLNLNGKPTGMEIDTGAVVSIMAEATFNEISAELQVSCQLAYLLSVMGEAMCNVEYVCVALSNNCGKWFVGIGFSIFQLTGQIFSRCYKHSGR